MKVNYSHELSQRIQNFLDNADLKYTFNSDIGSFWFKFHSPLSPFTYFLVHFLTENDCIQLDVTFPLSIASRHRSKIKEFISDCNYPMKNGCFHLNPRNGVLQFHIFIDSIDRIPTDKVLAHALACACTMMDFHCYKLLRLLTDTSEPEKADPLSPDSFLDTDFLDKILHSIQVPDESEDRSEGDTSSDDPFHVKSDEEEADCLDDTTILTEEDKQLWEDFLNHFSDENSPASDSDDENN